ncbi:hypothetical protein H0H93_009859 [Arthromyces matolae]|nr:hypothetical protein H0H93_009859 [Arthromyces matolae]
MSSPVQFIPLLSHETGGLIAVNAFALLSSAALVSVAFRVVWLAVKENVSPVSIKPREYVFFNTQLGYYAICLLIGNLLTDISGLIGLQWLVDKGITEAVLMQLGNWAIAYFTVAIAIHTFNSLVMRIRQSSIVSGIAITAGWILAVLVGTVLDEASSFYSPHAKSAQQRGLLSILNNSFSALVMV